MDWTAQVDGYCERLDAAFWAEPVNAISNLAFLIAAFVMWRWLREGGPVEARLLVAILTAIGVGSFLFHTTAAVWAGVADVGPIALFILVYVYAANRHFWRMNIGWSLVGVGLFFPYAVVLVPLFQQVPFYGASAEYMPVPLLIAIYAVLLRRRAPATARGLAIGVGFLMVSLSFRSLDMTVCQDLPIGTHFVWHLLNGVMLGWMIEVLRRHAVARGDG